MKTNKQLSICICTFNEHTFLYECLRSLLNQTIPTDNFEIIVFDNSNIMKSNEYKLCKQIADDFNHIKYIEKQTNGLSGARNLCLQFSESEYIHFIDDDVLVKNNFVENILNVIKRNPNIKIFGGKVIPNWKLCERPVWLSNLGLSYLSMLDFGKSELKMGEQEGMYLVGANIMFARSILVEYNGFSENLGRNGHNQSLLGAEENDIVFKAHESGHLVKYCPSVVVEHVVRPERLCESWFIKRVAWQSVSDIFTNNLYMKESGSWSNYKSGFKFLEENVDSLFVESKTNSQFDEKLKTAKLLAFYMLNKFE